MKRGILLTILSFALSLSSYSQETPFDDEAIFIYRNDSVAFTAFLRSELDSITLSKCSMDSLMTNEYQTQDFYTKSGVTRIPLEVIDSVTFNPIENKPKYNIVDIEPWMDYYTSHGTTDMWLAFSNKLPYEVKIGDVLKYGKSTDEFKYGFMGIVRNVQYGDSIVVRCDTMNIDDVFDEFMFFDEITLESYVEEEEDSLGQPVYYTRFRASGITTDENGVLQYDHSKDVSVNELIQKGEEWWDVGEDALTAAAEFLEEVADKGYADRNLINQPLTGEMDDLLDKKRSKALELLCKKYDWLDNLLKAVTIKGSWSGNMTLRLSAYKGKLVPLKLKVTNDLLLEPIITTSFGWKKEYSFEKEKENEFGIFSDCSIPILPPADFGGWFFYEVGAEFYAKFDCDAELSLTWSPSIHTVTSMSYNGLTWPTFDVEVFDFDGRKFDVGINFDGKVKEGIDIIAEFSCLNGFLHFKGGAAPHVMMSGKLDTTLFENDPSSEETHQNDQEMISRLFGDTEITIGAGVDFPVLIEANIPKDKFEWVPDWKWLQKELNANYAFSKVYEWEPLTANVTVLPKFKGKPKITVDKSEGKDVIEVEVEYKAACLDRGCVGVGIGTWDGDQFKLLCSEFDKEPAKFSIKGYESKEYTKYQAKFEVTDIDQIFSVYPYYKFCGAWPVRCGEEATFRFSDMNVKVGKPVDIGLSDGTLWSDTNFGGSGYADVPYFAWGESKGDKSKYDKDSYTLSFINESNDICNTFRDPVRNLWKDGWCMPSETDWQTLITECNWEWCEENGVYGFRISNKDPEKSLNSIFLPAYGYKSDSSKFGYNSKCVYASGSKPSFDVISLVCGETTINGLTADMLEEISPYWGISIRPVKKELETLPLPTEDYIDMGLSVDWASCNYGTTNPFLNSKYYSLGTETGSMPDGAQFDKTTYPYNGRTNEFPPTICGTSYDVVARRSKAPLGEEYRMPTNAEWMELVRECDWQWVSKNGMTGYYITSRKTDGKIFLPAVGYIDGNIQRSVLAECVYLSGDVAQNGAMANAFVAGDDISEYMLKTMEPYYGYQIRAVRQKNKQEPTYSELHNHMSVDLGLSVDWSNLNLGATDYYGSGDFYSWGDDKCNKKLYDQQTYDLSRDISLIISQISNTGFDIAKKTLGNGWRLPTKEECNELISCDWKVTTLHGVKGYLVTAKNGRSIFLPAVGERNDLTDIGDSENKYKGSRVGRDKHVVLMAGDKGNVQNKMAYTLQADIENNDISTRQRQAAIGFSVRPVRDASFRPVYVTTLDATDVIGTKAILNGFTGEGVSASFSEAKLLFEYGTDENKLDMSKPIRPVSGIYVSGTVSNLKPNTTYFYRLKFTYKDQATGNMVEEHGEIKSFTTLKSDGNVILTIQDFSEVFSKTATVKVWAENVELTSLRKQDMGVLFVSEKTYQEIGSKSIEIGGQGVCSQSAESVSADGMTVNLTDLTENTTYYVRPFAVVDGKAYYGGMKSMTTLSALNLITHEAEEVTSCSAYVEVTSEGFDFSKMAVKNMGIIYADVATYTLRYKDNPDDFRYQAEDVLREMPWDTGDGHMGFSIIELKKNTTYYYRPFVIIDGTTHYGQTKRLTTLSDMQISTNDATNVKRNSALISGIAKNPYIGEVYEAGFCWNTTGDPTYANGEHVVCEANDGNISHQLNDLHPSTTYYYRAYMCIRGEIEYSAVKSFTTRTDIYIDNSSHEYTDYGLPSGTLWATHDILNSTGTNRRYFTFFDTFGTDEYPFTSPNYWESDWDWKEVPIYPPYDGNITDSEGHLLPEYDPATLCWGEDWRLPTMEELIELANYRYGILSTFPDTYLGYGGHLFEKKLDSYVSLYTIGGGLSYGAAYLSWYCIRPVYKKSSAK